MVGRRIVGTSLVAAALLIGGTAQAYAQDGQRLVMVYNTPAQIAALEGQGYDVGYVGEKNEAAVYLTIRTRRCCALRASRSARSWPTRTTSRRARPRWPSSPTARRSRPRSPRTA